MIFLDTGYFKGLMDDNDIHHEEALNIEKYLVNTNETTVINTTVLVETLNQSVGTPENVSELYDELHAKNMVVQLTREDYLQSLMINGWYGNSINYSDCTILYTMMNLGINKIVSFDDDFKKINSLNVMFNI